MSILLGNAIVARGTQDSRWFEDVSTEGELFICHKLGLKGTLAQDDSCCLGKHQAFSRITLHQKGTQKGCVDRLRDPYLVVQGCEGTQAQAYSDDDPPNYSRAEMPSIISHTAIIVSGSFSL